MLCCIAVHSLHVSSGPPAAQETLDSKNRLESYSYDYRDKILEGGSLYDYNRRPLVVSGCTQGGVRGPGRTERRLWTELIWTELHLDGRRVTLDDGAPLGCSVLGRWKDGARFLGAGNCLDGRSFAFGGRSPSLDGQSVALDGADLDGAGFGRSWICTDGASMDDGRTEPDSGRRKRFVQTSVPSVHGRWTDGVTFLGAEERLVGRRFALDGRSPSLDGRSHGLDGAGLDGTGFGRTEPRFGGAGLDGAGFRRSWIWTDGAAFGAQRLCGVSAPA
eukprot:gene14346-biopygen12562